MNAAAKTTAPAVATGKPLAAGLTKKTYGYNADPKRIAKKKGWNKRFDMGDIESLAASIKTELERDPKDGGLLFPLRLKRVEGNPDFDFQLVDGERRFTAIQLLLSRGVEFPEGVLMKMVPKEQDDLTSRIQMITANTGKPFLPLEEAAAYQELLDGGMSVAQICKAVGRSDVHVRETMALLSATGELKTAMVTGAVSASTAKLIVSITKDDEAAQKELLEAAAAHAAAPTAKGKAEAKENLNRRIISRRNALAAKSGREVKIRVLSPAQVSDLGAKASKHLAVVAKGAGEDMEKLLADQIAFRALIAADDRLAAAYAFGAFQALLAVTGHAVDLEI